MAEGKNLQTYLVYDGESSYKRNDTQVLSWTETSKIDL